MPPEPLRVLLNDRVLWGPRTGIGHYVSELIRGIPSADPAIRLLPFCQKFLGWVPLMRRAGRRSGGDGRRLPSRVRQLIEKTYQAAFRYAGRLRGCVLYHEPCHIPGPWPGVTLTTIHDLSVLRFPEWHPADRVRWYANEFQNALARSHHFVAVSEFTKREMIELLGIAPNRITAIAHAPRPPFHPHPRDQVAAWLARQHLPAEYLLFVGTIEPRKNLDGILAAYARLPVSTRDRFPLLVAGPTGWGRDRIEGLITRHGVPAHVRVLGYQDDQALGFLYAGAKALVWPTFYEGFGLPPLEAMASGTPVIAANNSSLPEVVGDAGLLVDPQSVPQILDAMQAILDDPALAARLSAEGLRRSQGFSWARCAKQHAELYRRLAAR